MERRSATGVFRRTSFTQPGMVAMAFELPPLPYPKNALEPHISERTMDFHHGRHHQAYVTNLNNLVKGSPMESQSLEDIIKATYRDAGDRVGAGEADGRGPTGPTRPPADGRGPTGPTRPPASTGVFNNAAQVW